jgi:dTDP-glucose pyrophosphorylase/thiamine kinase-like enzyme
MVNQVIIPTAGTGSRMGNYTKNLNKALLPYKDKPIIGHIIENFPEDTKFIVALGHLGQQVRDFLELAYADRNITFVDADYTGPRSGTGYTLLQCKDHVDGAFWYVPCDTYFDETILDKVNRLDCYFVKDVSEKDSHLYTMFETDIQWRITDIKFKQSCDDSWRAFTGLMYIKDWQLFFRDLSNIDSNEFIGIIRQGSEVAALDSWLDFGNPEIYQTELSKTQLFDFTKKDEVTYICNNRVVKWWLDSTVAEKKYRKAQTNLAVYPDNCQYKNSHMAYDLFPGQTLYQRNHHLVFDRLLFWLHNDVWKTSDHELVTPALNFYMNKTLQRIDMFLKRYPNLETVNYVDGVEVKDYQYYLDKIDWMFLAATCRVGYTHGDLQFDNVIVSPLNEFKIIDWRQDFGGVVEVGDIYYDLAKLSGGFIINYAKIKHHNFNFEQDGDAVTLSIPNIDNILVYQTKLKKYILDNNLDYKKVQQLIPIIFWNMAPLHTAPFDKFLWYLGIKLFEELQNETTVSNTLL